MQKLYWEIDGNRTCFSETVFNLVWPEKEQNSEFQD